ncbi:LysR family transcriptional regulator [Alicyclobacillus fastidiosus]|uniref:LysR family transcriptional regulator n=1 Tax=Alicyclobacillus fastidiosus TaxID=392011 RepID=A0ABV5AD02_9BACL|nr:LysR family transcriptional regulator [Alicyclobacillus fastidiosus]WEH08822.1 LysR family transcriptional regulator [Alicyclobacillus fastidiosus]
MDLKKLLYFVTIVDEGQITRAAQRLHMAQPPLSLQLKAIEEELGVTLLERTNKSIELTQAGRMFYVRAKEILNSVDGMISEVKEHGAGLRGKLSIGTVMSCVSYLPRPIRISQERYPAVTFELWEGDTQRVEELLHERVIELGITRLPIQSDDLEMVRLNAESLVAIEPPTWDVLTERTISIQALRDYPLMVLHGQGGKGLFEMFVEMCQNIGFTPKIICESPDVATLLTLADAGLGIAIVPKLAVHLRPAGSLRYAEITPAIKSDTALVWLRNRRISSAARHFREILIDTIGNDA